MWRQTTAVEFAPICPARTGLNQSQFWGSAGFLRQNNPSAESTFVAGFSGYGFLARTAACQRCGTHGRYWNRDLQAGELMAKILIVDDTPDSGELLGKFLEAAGHEVACVPNGKEALASVISAAPDVILLDLIMPEMDGPSF